MIVPRRQELWHNGLMMGASVLLCGTSVVVLQELRAELPGAAPPPEYWMLVPILGALVTGAMAFVFASRLARAWASSEAEVSSVEGDSPTRRRLLYILAGGASGMMAPILVALSYFALAAVHAVVCVVAFYTLWRWPPRDHALGVSSREVP